MNSILSGIGFAFDKEGGHRLQLLLDLFALRAYRIGERAKGLAGSSLTLAVRAQVLAICDLIEVSSSLGPLDFGRLDRPAW